MEGGNHKVYSISPLDCQPTHILSLVLTSNVRFAKAFPDFPNLSLPVLALGTLYFFFITLNHL